MKAAQQMFNPEMMKKYSEVGMKVQALQEELSQTEIEVSTGDDVVTVKITGTQVPVLEFFKQTKHQAAQCSSPTFPCSGTHKR